MQRGFIPAAVRFEDGVPHTSTPPAPPLHASPVAGTQDSDPHRKTADGRPA